MLIVNAKAAFPDTIMPGFYRADKLTRVMGKFKGKTVVSAQDVENIRGLFGNPQIGLVIDI